jgi:serine protease AprX
MTNDEERPPGPRPPQVPRRAIAEPLGDPEARKRIGLDERPDVPQPIMAELNTAHPEGLEAVRAQFEQLVAELLGPDAQPPLHVAGALYRLNISVDDVVRLVDADARNERGRRLIHRVWPDFPVRPLTLIVADPINALAARRTFSADGEGIVWAVIDSGINGAHVHFQEHATLAGPVAELHRDFTADPTGSSGETALVDGFGHGTHVAGVIAGELPRERWEGAQLRLAQRVRDPVSGKIALEVLPGPASGEISGIARRCKLVSLKVLRDDGNGETSSIIRALRYVNEVNASGQGYRIHGVNLSLGYEFDASWFACGQSPMCLEVDQLVRSGVVVVAAAGNTGHGRLSSSARWTSVALGMTINDPGNADLAITVGATHREKPFTYGISYFSSKGPTGDGRAKPDLVAPGEKIVSSASGAALRELAGSPSDIATYVDDDGTSMAAPHVSGAAAAFLSVRREFIGRPDTVKRALTDTARTLGRVPDFEGRGLVDVMGAINAA